MKTSIGIILMMAVTASFSTSAFAQEALWSELNTKVVILYQQGKYSEAIKVAEEALEVAEHTFGPDSRGVATSLNNLAALYKAQGRYDRAEPLYKRSLAIREKTPGQTIPMRRKFWKIMPIY